MLHTELFVPISCYVVMMLFRIENRCCYRWKILISVALCMYKRVHRKQDTSVVSVDIHQEVKYIIFRSFLLSRAGLIKPLQIILARGKTKQMTTSTKVTCFTCNLVCKSIGGLTRHSIYTKCLSKSNLEGQKVQVSPIRMFMQSQRLVEKSTAW